MQIDISRFRETFYEEAAEHLANMESSLLSLADSSDHQELLNNIFRCARSIKGGSATFGLDETARFTHSLESLLDRMRAGEIEPTDELVDLLLKAVDVLKGLLAAAKSGGEPPAEREEVIAKLIVAQRVKDETPR